MTIIEVGNQSITVDTFAVAVYSLHRYYGGPEEGGWWYDTRELVAVAPADTAEDAHKLAEELREGRFKDTGRQLDSVLFGGSEEDAAYSLMHFEPGEKIPHDRSDGSHYE